MVTDAGLGAVVPFLGQQRLRRDRNAECAVGDADPVKATTLGFKNIERVMGYLKDAATDPMNDNSDLQELYNRTVGQWSNEANHVATLVSGASGAIQVRWPNGLSVHADPTRAAGRSCEILNENVFKAPAYLIRPDISERVEAGGMIPAHQCAAAAGARYAHAGRSHESPARAGGDDA